jgi:predicted HTH transcriptional regulator
MMGMANLRDGGLILIGLTEQGMTWELTGVDDDHLNSFDFDKIIDQLGKFSSPQVTVDIVVHQQDALRYLAFDVHQFSDSPVVCRRNTPDSVRGNDRLTQGEVYVRPTSGRPRTVKVTDAALMHDLLELAAESRARRMLEVGKRIGLVPAESVESTFDSELPALLRGVR